MAKKFIAEYDKSRNIPMKANEKKSTAKNTTKTSMEDSFSG